MSTKHKASVGAVLTAIGLLAGWSTGACRTYAQIEHRISVVETKQDASDKRLERMESKIDRLLERR